MQRDLEQSIGEARDTLKGRAVRRTLRSGESTMVERYLQQLRMRSGWSPVAGARHGASRQGLRPPRPTTD